MKVKYSYNLCDFCKSISIHIFDLLSRSGYNPFVKNTVENSQVTVLSHNLWFDKARGALPAMLRDHNVDIVALQETGQDLPDTIEGLKLARQDALSPRVGLAVYYNPKRWYIADPDIDTAAYRLPPTAWSEKLGLNPKGPRLQVIRLSPVNEEDKKLVVGNMHAANLVSTHRGRRKQIVYAAQRTLAAAGDFNSEATLIGDSNYPWFGSKLVKAVAETGLVYVQPKSKVSTYNRGPIRGQYDRAWTTKGLENINFSVLPASSSDHRAILVTNKYSK